jgi:hypothetical protein
VVLGGDDAEIAEVLFNKTPVGIDYFGSTTEAVVDVQGFSYGVKFTRPAEVPVYVSVGVTVLDASAWPSDGADKVKAAIVAYATVGASGLGVDCPVFDQNGYVPGETVYASDLYVPVNSIPGITITSLQVGSVAPGAAASVPIDWDKLATFDAANIIVAVS